MVAKKDGRPDNRELPLFRLLVEYETEVKFLLNWNHTLPGVGTRGSYMTSITQAQEGRGRTGTPFRNWENGGSLQRDTVGHLEEQARAVAQVREVGRARTGKGCMVKIATDPVPGRKKRVSPQWIRPVDTYDGVGSNIIFNQIDLNAERREKKKGRASNVQHKLRHRKS